MKVSELSNDELVKVYVQLRDRREQRKTEFKAADSADESKQEKIEAILLARYQEQGIESARTQYGTAYKAKEGYASVADKDALWQYVNEHNARALLTITANRKEVRAHIDEYGELPPGVNWREEIRIRVNRA